MVHICPKCKTEIPCIAAPSKEDNETLMDVDIRRRLREIDKNEDIEVNEWEAKFLESLLDKYHGPLSPKQKEAALNLIEKYEE